MSTDTNKPEGLINRPQSPVLALAYDIAKRFAQLPQVQAVVLAGSQTFHSADPDSDIDLYVYGAEIPLEARRLIATENALRSEVNNQFWEDGDEWLSKDPEVKVDVMFRSPQWLADQVYKLFIQKEASIGYSTCFWHNILTSQILYDRDEWFARMQNIVQRPYPPELQRAIITKNYPILRDNMSSYTKQIQRALKRNDFISVNHRISALLASYFDILFAINELPHPGEKRLLQLTETNCTKLPVDLQHDIQAIFESDPFELLSNIHQLINHLDDLLIAERLHPTK